MADSRDSSQQSPHFGLSFPWSSFTVMEKAIGCHREKLAPWKRTIGLPRFYEGQYLREVGDNGSYLAYVKYWSRQVVSRESLLELITDS